jgi:hypothetical protein
MSKEPRKILNRFQAATCTCPRCNERSVIDKYVVNVNVNGMVQGCPFITFACPVCGDIVQVAMAGESEANSYIDR